jgi:hypothetical protein
MPPPRRRCPPHPPTGHIQACHAPAPVSCLPQALAAAARLRPRTAGDEAVHPWSPPLPPPTETLRPAWPSAPPAGTSPNRACGVGCAVEMTHIAHPRLPITTSPTTKSTARGFRVVFIWIGGVGCGGLCGLSSTVTVICWPLAGLLHLWSPPQAWADYNYLSPIMFLHRARRLTASGGLRRLASNIGGPTSTVAVLPGHCCMPDTKHGSLLSRPRRLHPGR